MPSGNIFPVVSNFYKFEQALVSKFGSKQDVTLFSGNFLMMKSIDLDNLNGLPLEKVIFELKRAANREGLKVQELERTDSSFTFKVSLGASYVSVTGNLSSELTVAGSSIRIIQG